MSTLCELAVINIRDKHIHEHFIYGKRIELKQMCISLNPRKYPHKPPPEKSDHFSKFWAFFADVGNNFGRKQKRGILEKPKNL